MTSAFIKSLKEERRSGIRFRVVGSLSRIPALLPIPRGGNREEEANSFVSFHFVFVPPPSSKTFRSPFEYSLFFYLLLSIFILLLSSWNRNALLFSSSLFLFFSIGSMDGRTQVAERAFVMKPRFSFVRSRFRTIEVD